MSVESESRIGSIHIVSPLEIHDLEEPLLAVSVWAPADDFRARLNGRDVTCRFSEPVSGVRSAVFERGTDFDLGPGTFMAAVGECITATQETVGFSFTAWQITESGHAQLELDENRQTRVKRAVLNGRVLFEHPGSGAKVRVRSDRFRAGVDLSADDGLTYGDNLLVEDVPCGDYVSSRIARSITIAKTAPLAGAGRSRIVSVGNSIILDGSESKSAFDGSRLRFRWSIAEGPTGAQAEISDPANSRARFVGNTPGRYLVRLAVSEVLNSGDEAPADELIGVDEVEIAVVPTDDPMGLPIQTIDEQGDIRIGSRNYGSTSEWLRMLVLDQTVLTEISDLSYNENDLQKLQADINRLTGDEIVIVTARPQGHRTPGAVDEKLFREILGSVGAVAESPDGAWILAKRRFSVIGRKGLNPGQAWQNSTDLSAPDSGGSLKGYLQMASGNAFSFVSPEMLALDTEASGSDGYTRNVIKISDRAFPSESIQNGATALQLVALDGERLDLRANLTFELCLPRGAAVEGERGDPKHGKFGSGVIGLAAALDYFRAEASGALLVLQTFGQGQWWGNTPNGSPSWANDDVEAKNFPTWDGRLFAVSDGSENPTNALYRVWNPGYPTVAGQIGALTSGAGHDIVTAFGFQQYNQGTSNGGLTVVASTHPYDGRRNFIQGQTGQVQSRPRLVGTLIRTRQWQWSVQTSSSSPEFEATRLWEVAFGPAKDWPYAEGAGYRAAMAHIADQLWPGSGIVDLRPQYVLKKSADWDGLALTTGNLQYPAGSAFTEAEFDDVRTQLVTEMLYVAAMKNIVTQWRRVFRDATFSGYVDLQSIARTVIDNALANAKRHEHETTSLDWLDIVGYSLSVASSILGFTPAEEIAAPLGLVANVFGLASALSPGHESGGSSRPNSQKIWNRADLLAQDLLARFDQLVDLTNHIEDILFSNWGKLEQAGAHANGSWAFGTAVQRTFAQAIAVSAKRAFYRALLPLTYEQWVISPNRTGAENDPQWGPDGLELPGRNYRSWGAGDGAYPHPPGHYPFANSPDGALHYGGVHGWTPPGSTTPPAADDQVWYEIRVLKSKDDPLVIKPNEYYRGGNPTIWQDGSNPPASLVNPLFEPIDPSDVSGNPIKLGIDKTHFFGDFNDGWGWRKAIAS
ncbi:hypothetical protein [Methylosinus sp. LW3]|uniref:hypothetical protein n=1 Tax=Methylosinus sp. LW3 TaxID=107635 RepID=UPI0012F814EA|nr:hypothetical protein [Methylosinus sp. LW3]